MCTSFWRIEEIGRQSHEDEILKKVVGEKILHNDEFLTLVYEAAAILNSRPLAPPPDGVSLLTPGHFTIGRPPAALPLSCWLHC